MEQPGFPEEEHPRCDVCRLILRDEEQLATHLLSTRHRRREKQQQEARRKLLLGLYGWGLGWSAARGVVVWRRHLPNLVKALIRSFLIVPREWTAVYFGEKSW